jgi:carbohydrate-selective porin OprB
MFSFYNLILRLANKNSPALSQSTIRSENKDYSDIEIRPASYRTLILLLILAITFFNQSFAQPPANQNNLFMNLKNKGLTFGVSESLEGYRNFKGGIRKGNAYASTLDANLTVDLQKILGLNHGIFYVDFEDHAGNNPTSKLTGDAQVFDKHTSDPFFQTMEIWYQQQLFKNKLRIKL